MLLWSTMIRSLVGALVPESLAVMASVRVRVRVVVLVDSATAVPGANRLPDEKITVRVAPFRLRGIMAELAV